MKILSFGEILFDVFENNACLGGAPLNLAAHAALQGADAYIWSEVGTDALGIRAVKEIRQLGVKTDLIGMSEQYRTGKCTVTLDKNGIPVYAIDKACAFDHIAYPDFSKEDFFDVLAFGTLALRQENNRQVLQTLIGENRCREVYTDLNIRKPFASEESVRFCMQHATIVKISDEELPFVCETLFGKEYARKEAFYRLHESFPAVKRILITCGENGAAAFDCTEEKLYFCPSEKVDVVSTVGAGDSFGATFLMHCFDAGDMQKALAAASKVSGYVVSKTDAIPNGMQDFLKSVRG